MKKEILLNGEDVKGYSVDRITKENVKRVKFQSSKIKFIIDFITKGTLHEIKRIKVKVDNCKFEYDTTDEFLQDFYINDNGYFIHDNSKQELCLLLNPEFADEININSFLYSSSNFKFRIFRG